MAASHEIPGPPEQDPSVVKMYGQGLWEVPNLAGKGVPMLDTSSREIGPDEEILRKLSTVSDPFDLLDPETRGRLFDKLAESERIRREAEADACFLKI